MTSNVIEGPWGPPAPGEAPAGMPAYDGLAAYEVGAQPSAPAAQAMAPPMQVPQPVSYGNEPLVDTSGSVTFALPTAPYAPAFASYAPPQPEYVQAATQPYPPPRPFPRGGKKKGLGEPPTRTSAALGLSLLLVGVGAAVGAKYRGMFGGIAGGLYGGALINGIRAVRSLTDGAPASDSEAAISGTYALLGAGVATYVLYQTRAPADDKKKG